MLKGNSSTVSGHISATRNLHAFSIMVDDAQEWGTWAAVLAVQGGTGRIYGTPSLWNCTSLEGISDKKNPEKKLKLIAMFPYKHSWQRVVWEKGVFKWIMVLSNFTLICGFELNFFLIILDNGIETFVSLENKKVAFSILQLQTEEMGYKSYNKSDPTSYDIQIIHFPPS